MKYYVDIGKIIVKISIEKIISRKLSYVVANKIPIQEKNFKLDTERNRETNY